MIKSVPLCSLHALCTLVNIWEGLKGCNHKSSPILNKNLIWRRKRLLLVLFWCKVLLLVLTPCIHGLLWPPHYTTIIYFIQSLKKATNGKTVKMKGANRTWRKFITTPRILICLIHVRKKFINQTIYDPDRRHYNNMISMRARKLSSSPKYVLQWTYFV